MSFELIILISFIIILISLFIILLINQGMETIPSEAACFPAKLTHGHVSDLIERKVGTIFIPQV